VQTISLEWTSEDQMREALKDQLLLMAGFSKIEALSMILAERATKSFKTKLVRSV